MLWCGEKNSCCRRRSLGASTSVDTAEDLERVRAVTVILAASSFGRDALAVYFLIFSIIDSAGDICVLRAHYKSSSLNGGNLIWKQLRAELSLPV